MPVDRSAPSSLIAAGRRSPAGDAGSDAGDRKTDFVVPVLLGPAPAPTIERLAVTCADDAAVHLDLATQDAAGLARIEIVLANRQGAGLPDRLPASLQASNALGTLQIAADCKATPPGAGLHRHPDAHALRRPGARAVPRRAADAPAPGHPRPGRG
ncbi:MAG: hypothetical protein R3F60_15550 [bacterium]